MKTAEFGKYHLDCVFGTQTAQQTEDIIDFWLRCGAITEREEAVARAPQVAWIARDPSGTLVAVCTLFTEGYGKPPLPHHYFRAFIAESERRSHLAFNLVALVRKMLVAQEPANTQGLIIVAQNPAFLNDAARQVFKDWGWSFEGVAEGFDIWRLAPEALDLTLPDGLSITG